MPRWGFLVKSNVEVITLSYSLRNDDIWNTFEGMSWSSQAHRQMKLARPSDPTRLFVLLTQSIMYCSHLRQENMKSNHQRAAASL